MIFALIKKDFKQNWMLFVIFLGILTMYTSIMIYIYSPEDVDAMLAVMSVMPEDLLKAMGFSATVTNLTTFIASWLYGMLMFAFPMIYSIILGNRLVAKMVDDHSFAYLLSTPNSRVKLILTQGIFALSSMLLLFIIIFIEGIVFSEIMFAGELNIPAFFKLNLVTMLLNMAILMITFFFSCLFNESKRSSGFGSGVPIALMLMNMLGNTGDELNFLKNLTLYGLYDPIDLVNGVTVLFPMLLYIGLVVILLTSGIIIFNRKRLPL